MFFQPLKIGIPPFYLYIKGRGINGVAYIRLTEQTALLFGEPFDLDVDVFGQKGVWSRQYAFDRLGEYLVTAFVIVFEILALLFYDDCGCA